MPDESEPQTVTFDWLGRTKKDELIVIETKNQLFQDGDDERFIDQIKKQIFAVDNHPDLKGVKFEVWSEHPLTDGMKKFLDEKNIKYVEGYTKLLSEFVINPYQTPYNVRPVLQLPSPKSLAISSFGPAPTGMDLAIDFNDKIFLQKAINTFFGKSSNFKNSGSQKEPPQFYGFTLPALIPTNELQYAHWLETTKQPDFTHFRLPPFIIAPNKNIYRFDAFNPEGIHPDLNIFGVPKSQAQTTCGVDYSQTSNSYEDVASMLNKIFDPPQIEPLRVGNIYPIERLMPPVPEALKEMSTRKDASNLAVEIGSGGIAVSARAMEFYYGAGALTESMAATSAITAAGIIAITALAAYGFAKGVQWLIKVLNAQFDFDEYPTNGEKGTQKSALVDPNDSCELEANYCNAFAYMFDNLHKVPEKVIVSPFYESDHFIIPFWLYLPKKDTFYVSPAQQKLSQLGASVRIDVQPSPQTQIVIRDTHSTALRYSEKIKRYNLKQLEKEMQKNRVQRNDYAREVNRIVSRLNERTEKFINLMQIYLYKKKEWPAKEYKCICPIDIVTGIDSELRALFATYYYYFALTNSIAAKEGIVQSSIEKLTKKI